MDFTRKTVLVTGASRGIGKAIAEEFLANGARVIGVSTSREGSVKSPEGNYIHIKLDLAETKDYQKALQSIPKSFSDIDILVNNAGIKVTTEFPASEVSDWNKTMDINLRSVYFLSQLVSPILAREGGGRIINIASQSGVAHVRSSIEYGLSKAGVIYLTKSLARVLAKDNITVNAVSPGRTYTDMTSYEKDSEKLNDTLNKIPLGAINTPQEVASAVLFLASDSAHNITGQIIGIDGGEANF